MTRGSTPVPIRMQCLSHTEKWNGTAKRISPHATITESPARIRGCSEVVFDLFRTGFLQHGLNVNAKPEALSVCGVQMYCPRHCVVYKTIPYYTPIVRESQS